MSDDNSILLLTREIFIQVPIYSQNMSITITNLSKRYGNQWALRDVSFVVNPDEILGIFGPSGSGKSTLLGIISGSEKPGSGSISSDDSPEFDRDTILINGTPETSFWQRALSPTIDLNDVSMRVELSLEAAIKGGNRFLLMDDPFRLLDATAREKQFKLVQDNIKLTRKSAIFATADFREIMAICDRVIVLAAGRVLQEGVPQDVYSQPNSREVALLTGRNNLFEARRLTSSKADQPEFHTIIGEHRLFTQKTDLNSLGAINKNVTLAIRPEHVSISFGASFPADNLLKARIVDYRFRGPFTLVELECAGLKIQALVLRLVGLSIGDECMVGLPPERIIVLKN